MKVLTFEFCTNIGDESIKSIFQCYGETLEKFSITRSFYENCLDITGSCFDLDKEKDHHHHHKTNAQDKSLEGGSSGMLNLGL